MDNVPFKKHSTSLCVFNPGPPRPKNMFLFLQQSVFFLKTQFPAILNGRTEKEHFLGSRVNRIKKTPFKMEQCCSEYAFRLLNHTDD